MKCEKILIREDGSSVLYSYILDSEVSYKKYKKRPAIVICPGGSYLFCATKEGEPVASRFLGMGYNVFVLRYITYFKNRISNINEKPLINKNSKYPEQVLDLMRVIRMIKNNSEQWGIDKENIFTMGFSAGGHIVALLGNNWDDDGFLEAIEERDKEICKPKGTILCYPMIHGNLLKNYNIDDAPESIKYQLPYIKKAIFGTNDVDNKMLEKVNVINSIRKDMPPTFIWHTSEDNITFAKDSVLYAMKMLELNIPCEVHIFERGHHGMALCDEVSSSLPSDINNENKIWPILANNWMKLQMENKENANK